jgi:hypothetical protein
MFHGVAIVAHVAFVLRLKRFEFCRRPREAELCILNASSNRFPTSGQSHPVPEFDIAFDEFRQIKVWRLTESAVTAFCTILIVLVAVQKILAAVIGIVGVLVLAGPRLVHICEGEKNFAIEFCGDCLQRRCALRIHALQPRPLKTVLRVLLAAA